MREDSYLPELPGLPVKDVNLPDSFPCDINALPAHGDACTSLPD